VKARDVVAILAGAEVAVLVGLLAEVKNPRHALWIAFWVLFVPLVLSTALMWWRSAWVTTHITPLSRSGSTWQVRVGLRNRSREDISTGLNVLVPDVARLERTDPDGRPTTGGTILPTSESVDGVHGSIYWNNRVVLAGGSVSTLYHFGVTSPHPRLSLRLKIPKLGYVEDFHFDLTELNHTESGTSSRLRQTIIRSDK
jgi:hypothetical protein